MRREYLVFNIDNCAEDYIGVYRFLDEISGTADQVEAPRRLRNKIYKYQCEENCGSEKCSMEKCFRS